MKLRTSLLLGIAIVGCITMNSCTKKYTCQCAITYSGYPGLPDSTTQSYYITDSKSGAKSKCSGESGTYDNNGIHAVETCVLY